MTLKNRDEFSLRVILIKEEGFLHRTKETHLEENLIAGYSRMLFLEGGVRRPGYSRMLFLEGGVRRPGYSRMLFLEGGVRRPGYSRMLFLEGGVRRPGYSRMLFLEGGVRGHERDLLWNFSWL